MPDPSEDPVVVHNLRVIFFNWLPAIGCLAAGVTGLVVGIDAGVRQTPNASVGGGLYLLAGAIGFAMFGWLWRR